MDNRTIPTEEVRVADLSLEHLFAMVEVGGGAQAVRGELVGIRHYAVVTHREGEDEDEVIDKESRCDLTIEIWDERQVEVPTAGLGTITVFDYSVDFADED